MIAPASVTASSLASSPAVVSVGYASGAAIVLGVAVMTYLMRASVIVALGERTLPPTIARALRYVGPAVLAALTVSLAAGSGEGSSPSIGGVELAALVVGAVVAWRWRNLIAVLLAGMAVIWIGVATGLA